MPVIGLRRYKGLPPGEQDRALQNDPGFRHMTPQQQQRLRQQLHYFASLPPRQQQRIVDNMDRWAHLTPEQKQVVNRIAAASARPSAHGHHCGARSERHVSRRARQDDQFGPLQENVLT